jgi:hypothetical protein
MKPLCSATGEARTGQQGVTGTVAFPPTDAVGKVSLLPWAGFLIHEVNACLACRAVPCNLVGRETSQFQDLVRTLTSRGDSEPKIRIPRSSNEHDPWLRV